MNIENLKKARYIFLDGYFNSFHLFNDYKEEISKSIKTNFELKFHNNKKQNLFENDKNRKICIHYRSYNDVPLNDRHGNLVVNDIYYKNAINFFIKKYNDPSFIVFSDNINEARKIINTEKAIFVENDEELLPSQIKDFLMMLKCDHFIIANSTFSWWAAYLANNKNKTVIRPSEKFYAQNKNFYPDEWIEI
jgi:hypothetical protein